MNRLATLLLVAATSLLIAANVHAQIEFAEPIPYEYKATEPLRSACDSAWRRVDEAIFRGVRADINTQTTEGQETVRCLLKAIDHTPFDPRSDQFNNVLVMATVRSFINSLREPSYDFFAAEMDSQPERIRRSIQTVLADKGHPEAWRRHFITMAPKVSGLDVWRTRVNAQTPGQFKTFLENGTCPEPECSRHIGETLQIFSRNLDIIDAELEGSENWSASSKARTADQEAANIRAMARDMRDLVHRIQSGEVRIGQAVKSR